MSKKSVYWCGSLLTVLAVCAVVSCAKNEAKRTHDILAGTSWRLVEIQSMDDSIGTVRPDDPSLYTMQLADSTVSMRLNCNRAHGTWAASPASSDSSGSFTFSPLAMTRMLCPPPSLDERIARDAQYFRSYLFSDGRLCLSLMADGGIYVWEPDTTKVTGH